MTIPAPHPDRTCLVTGASSGIGLEIAHLLARRGLGVTLVARSGDKLERLAEELTKTYGVRAGFLVCDLADETARAGLPAAIAERGLGVNVLVNNAGFSTTGPVWQADSAGELAMVRTNVEAVVHLCTMFLPAMVERRSGSVLNVASTAAFQPIPGQAGYAASKSFVLSYTHGLRGELRETGVTATALCPGPVRTGFAEAAGLDEKVLDETLPAFVWVSAADVAKAGVEAMDEDRAVVIPGAANKVMAGAGWLTPRSLIVPLMKKFHPVFVAKE
jgi:hypothetical protein